MPQIDIRIGLVGLDTSHSVAFTKCFNRTDHPDHVPGGKVVIAYPGGSKDFDLSISRVPGYSKTLSEEYGVQLVDSPAAVAEACDLLILGSCDGRVHRKQFEQVVSYHRPTFIDKPMAVSTSDAKAIFDLAARENTPVMSCSSLRYAENLQHALENSKPIVGLDVFGPMGEEPTQPGLFWYGIHQVEIIQRVMGTGCKEVRAVMNASYDVLTFLYDDGRIATMRGVRAKWHPKFGAVLHRETGPELIDVSGGKRTYYACLLDAIMRTLPRRTVDIKPQETLEIIRMIEAANEARDSGKAVTV